MRNILFVHFVFNKNKILRIYLKALDSDFQLISKMLLYFKKKLCRYIQFLEQTAAILNLAIFVIFHTI